ncbi:hypothetical protein FKM82_008009 [Ascaphus truei]
MFCRVLVPTLSVHFIDNQTRFVSGKHWRSNSARITLLIVIICFIIIRGLRFRLFLLQLMWFFWWRFILFFLLFSVPATEKNCIYTEDDI